MLRNQGVVPKLLLRLKKLFIKLLLICDLPKETKLKIEALK